MPWIINEKGQYEYKQMEYGPSNLLNDSEKKNLNFLKTYISQFGEKHAALDSFLKAESVKPISFNIEKADGSTQVQTLSAEETQGWLSGHKNVFREAGREPACHLLAFAIKNGLTMEDIYLLKDHPQDSRCAGLRVTFEKARKEMFEAVSTEDTRVPENSTLSVRESKLVNFFTDYFIKVNEHLENIKNSSKTDSEKTLAYEDLFMQYQSLALQSLAIGSRSGARGEDVDWKKLIPVIDTALKERGANFKFDNMMYFGRLSRLIAQSATNIKNAIDGKAYEKKLITYRDDSFVDFSKVAYVINYLSDKLWHSGSSASDVIKSFGENQMAVILDKYANTPTYVPGNITGDEELMGMVECDNNMTDAYLDDKLSKFASRTVPADFEHELHTLADSFGNQRNPMDPGFGEMTKGLAKLSEVYHSPNANYELKITALRYAQLKAAEYLDKHPEDLTSDSPRPAVLLAEKIFTLAGTQKLALRGNIQPGAVIRGSAEYRNHNLSLENINAMAPVKLTSRQLKANRYETIMRKHGNADDLLPDAKKHIQEETTADYSRIDKITDRKNVPVHSALGKQNREQGGYNLEFVCAGSSNIQMAKTYKGQTGRNELGKLELTYDPVAQEIVNNVKQKYNIKFDKEEPGDNTKYEWALEQDYGKPMYLDENKVLHEEPAEGARFMAGIRKLEKGNTTRYNISGAMEKVLGVFFKPGASNTGDYSINNNKDYMIGLADKWLSDINAEYQTRIQQGRQDELKPINIMFKGHSRGGVAANESSMMVNYLVEHKYPQLREYVHISTQLLDPVPGLGSNLEHPGVDLNKGDYNHDGRNMRGLKASAAEKKNNTATVFYDIHSNNNVGFAPQNVVGADRVIFTCMLHDTGVFDAVDGHKRGYLAENGEEYRGSGLNELPHGLYFVDENKNIVSCKNSHEAHKAIDAMLGKHAKHSRQWSRHSKMHEMVDSWFKANPEVITSKDTRYPLEQAMQEDKRALKDVLNSFDYTRPETELSVDPNIVLQRGISSLLAHQLLLNQMNDTGKRFYPESVDETKKLLAESDASGLADRIRKSDSFKLFYESLNKEDIKVLASANSIQLKSYLNNLKAIVNLSPEAKRQINNENLALRSANQVGRKNMFFEKHIGPDGEWNPHIPNRLGLSADRTALNIIAISRLMREGKKLKDIMDPFKLERERQAVGDKVYHDYTTMKDSELAESASDDILYGFERSLDEIDEAMGSLENISLEELSKPENAYILRCRDLITNYGQELGGKGKPMFDSLVARSKNPEALLQKIDHLFTRQVTGNLVMHRLEEAQTTVNNMINHPENFENTDEALTNVGGAVFTVMGMDTKFKELKTSEGANFKFSESLGAIKETDIENCKATIQGSEIYNGLKDFIAQPDDPDATVPSKVQKLGREFQSGTLFSGKFKIQDNGMGFAPVEGVDGLIDALEGQPVPQPSEKDRQAWDIYKNSRSNIANYQKKARTEPALSEENQQVKLNEKKAVTVSEDSLKAFLTEKISKATGVEIDKEHLEENLDYFVTYGDDNNRNRMFVEDSKTTRMNQIKTVLENGGKLFITLPDLKYHTMDTSEIVFKDGKPKLNIPKLEHDAMTVSVREVCKRINAAGDIKDASPEFNEFKQTLNEISVNGIPKDTEEYFSTMNDLAKKAYDFGVKNIDQKMNKKQDACVTAASQILEIYRAVCMHEKASKDGMNLSMIASKYYKTKLANDIKNGRPMVKAKAQRTLADYDKYVAGVAEITDSKAFKNMFRGMSSEEIEKFAHKTAADITKEIEKVNKKQAEPGMQIR